MEGKGGCHSGPGAFRIAGAPTPAVRPKSKDKGGGGRSQRGEAAAGEWMNSGRFEMMSLAAGICLTLAMPLAAAAQQQPQGLRYQPPTAMGMLPSLPAPPPLTPVTPDGHATVVEGVVARVN